MNALQLLGLPDPFGLTLLILAVVLAISPWAAGHDFGVLKVPKFKLSTRKRLRLAGPVLLLGEILLHVPLASLPSSTGDENIPSSAESPDPPTDTEPDETSRAVLALSLYNVRYEDKGQIVATTELTSKSSEFEEALLSNLNDWLTEKLMISPLQTDVSVTVNIPGDWETGQPILTREPEGPVSFFLRYVPNLPSDSVSAADSSSGGKIRFPVTSRTDSLAAIAESVSKCELEINVPGYASRSVAVNRGEDIRETLTFQPKSVQIGIETLTGTMPEISERIAGVLSKHPRIDVVSPNMLERVREELKEHNAAIRANPATQQAFRSLSVEYILGGSVYAKKLAAPDEPG